MTTDQLNRRAALLARMEAALARWPERRGAEYEAESAAIAEELDALARAMDQSEVPLLERLRTWRHAGDTHLRVNGGRVPLQRASAAFRSAESLAYEADADAVELVKLNHAFGATLLKLSDGEDEELASAAATRLSTALSLARKHMPAGVVAIKHELLRAEHTATVLRGNRARRREAEVA